MSRFSFVSRLYFEQSRRGSVYSGGSHAWFYVVYGLVSINSDQGRDNEYTEDARNKLCNDPHTSQGRTGCFGKLFRVFPYTKSEIYRKQNGQGCSQIRRLVYLTLFCREKFQLGLIWET